MRVPSTAAPATGISALPRDGPSLLPAGHSLAAPRHPAASVGRPVAPSPFARLLHGLASEIEGGEGMVRHTVARMAGAEESPRPLELLALQADVYRYSEALDLAARLVDRAATSVKTVLQGQ